MDVLSAMNHLHLQDIQHVGYEGISEDKLPALGRVLKEMYEARLKWQFPERQCIVEFFVPADAEGLSEYQISFWQTAHESSDGTSRPSRDEMFRSIDRCQ
jgi:hypothetical protein